MNKLIIQICDEAGNDLATIDTNTVQIRRCIKRETGTNEPVSDSAVVERILRSLETVGEDWKRQMFQEDDVIRATALSALPRTATTEQRQAAIAEADTQIEALNT